MKASSAVRFGVAGLAMGGIALLAIANAPAQGQSSLIQDGKLGFVVSNIMLGLSNSTDAAAMCPDGLSLGPREIFELTPDGRRREGETEAAYGARLRTGAQAVMTAPNGQNLCMNPEAGAPEPHHYLARGAVPVYGIDLDGQDSRANGRAAAGTCAHDDYRGVNGERGIDNQFFRAVGCTKTLQPGGQGNTFNTEMWTGAWGILITLENVQDLRNDNDVTVRFFANNDPIVLSPNREPLPNATYAIEHNPRYQATTRGRITNSVLTTEPVEVRFHNTVNNIRVDRPLLDARLRMTIGTDGAMEGILAGYSPVEEVYDVSFGFRSGVDAAGNLSRARQGSSNGFAFTAQHTCHGAYFALQQMADGHRDPATGRCTSISTQYRVWALPAFVVDAETRSLNQDLAR